MSRHFPRSATASFAIAVLVAFAHTASASGDHAGGHGDGGEHAVAFGEPAPAAKADRTVRITARDTMRFEPDSVRVRAGETVRFVVENVGKLQHSFTLGTPKAQEKHEAEMKGMPAERMASHMEDDPTGMVVQPGETGTLTWRFADGGPVQFACHIPGHFPAGMTGRIRIQ